MKLQMETKGKIGIVRIEERIDAVNASDLKKQFSDWLETTNQFIFDMKDVDFIDSTGLGAIVACLKYASEVNGDLKLATLPPKPRMIFEITKAYRIFDIYDDVESALEAYQQS